MVQYHALGLLYHIRKQDRLLAITKLLAQQTQQQSQTVISARFNKILRAADVTVDPQIGSWNPKNQTQLVLPPPVPSAPSSAKPLANKLPGSSAP